MKIKVLLFVFIALLFATPNVFAARLESMSTTPGESVNKQLGLAKLKNCIAYKTELSKLS